MNDFNVYTDQNLLPYKGEVMHYPDFINAGDSKDFLKILLHEIVWKQEPIKLFGKSILQPRLTAWYANEGITYSYSGITMKANTWTKTLLTLKEKIEAKTGSHYNSALLNLYRNGSDSMGWHRDNEKELGKTPNIASLSFGATRKFQLRDYQSKSHLLSLELKSGSLLVMSGESQQAWEHQVPKTKTITEPRINITFRQVLV